MKKLSLKPELGQHLTVNNEVLNEIINAAEINKNDIVIEIGAGTGFLTEKLCEKTKKVIAYEIDRQFESYLQRLKSKYPNLEIRFENVRRAKIDFPYNKVVGTIPYHIAEPLIWKFRLEPVEIMVFVVGEKFAHTLTKDFTKEKVHSDLPLIFQSRFKIKLLKIYPKNYFQPTPPVDSALIKFTSITKESLKNNFMRYIVRYLFDHKGSKLKNALREALINYWKISKDQFLSKKRATEMIQRLNLPSLKLEHIVDGANVFEIINLVSKIKK